MIAARFIFGLILGAAAAWAAWRHREYNQTHNWFAPTFSVSAAILLMPLIVILLGSLLHLLLGIFWRSDSVPRDAFHPMPEAAEYLRLVLYLGFMTLPSLLLLTLLLLAMIPWLRNKLSAEACATLWTLPCSLLPVRLFVFLALTGSDRPQWIIRLPRAASWVLPLIWLVGFVGILGWKLWSHLRFRKTLLRAAVPAPEREQEIFREVRDKLCQDKQALSSGLLVLHSPAAVTPLAVGLFRRKICLVLPDQAYTEDELRLIYRHEIIHLLHRDNSLKFSVTVLCAMGWFVPSLWAGMKKASEDMELCCDELATSGFEESRRRQYADLLLSSAGTARGFTTCLSASASGLRYRMQKILKPKIRSGGILVLALMMALAFSFVGLLGAGLEDGTVQTQCLDLFGGGWEVTGFGRDESYVPCKDPKNAEAWLGELELMEPLWRDSVWNEPGYYSNVLRIELRQESGQLMYLYIGGRDDAPYLECKTLVEDETWGDWEKTRYSGRISGPVNLDRLRSMGTAGE